jgi:hypothetical protein
MTTALDKDAYRAHLEDLDNDELLGGLILAAREVRKDDLEEDYAAELAERPLEELFNDEEVQNRIDFLTDAYSMRLDDLDDDALFGAEEVEKMRRERIAELLSEYDD